MSWNILPHCFRNIQKIPVECPTWCLSVHHPKKQEWQYAAGACQCASDSGLGIQGPLVFPGLYRLWSYFHSPELTLPGGHCFTPWLLSDHWEHGPHKYFSTWASKCFDWEAEAVSYNAQRSGLAQGILAALPALSLTGWPLASHLRKLPFSISTPEKLRTVVQTMR